MLEVSCHSDRGKKGSRINNAAWLLFAASVMSLSGSPAMAGQPWFPVQVDVWQPPFNSERQRVEETYTPLERASQPWRVCVLFPHLKDAYWLAVNFAVVDEARRLGLTAAIYSAGGYEHLDRQRAQFEECLADEPDGILLSAVSVDGLNDLVAAATGRGTPVIDLINGVSSPKITARVGVDFWDMGHASGTYLAGLQARRDAPIRVAWFPGPAGAGWVEASDAGFRHAISGRPIEIVQVANGDTGRAVQRALVETALAEHPGNIEYLVGTAVTAEAAVGVVRQQDLNGQVGILADYYSPGVHRAIKRGEVIGAPSDLPALQTRIALDVLARALEGREFFPHVAAKVIMIDRDKLATWDASLSLPPRGFRPVFNVSGQ